MACTHMMHKSLASLSGSVSNLADEATARLRLQDRGQE